jgi:hypothetical protein
MHVSEMIIGLLLDMRTQHCFAGPLFARQWEMSIWQCSTVAAPNIDGMARRALQN